MNFIQKIILKSTINSLCLQCNQVINVGDEIVRISNGLWTHETCSDNGNNEIKKTDDSESSLVHISIPREDRQGLIKATQDFSEVLSSLNRKGMSEDESRELDELIEKTHTLNKALDDCDGSDGISKKAKFLMLNFFKTF